MTFYIWQAAGGFVFRNQGLRHIAIYDGPGGRTFCGKKITPKWVNIGEEHHEHAAIDSSACRTCASVARRKRKERLKKTPRLPEGQMYAGHRIRSL